MIKENTDDFVGKTFNRLTTVRRVENTHDGLKVYECKCVCGELVCVRKVALTSGHSKSCGCLRKEAVARSVTTHGRSSNCSLYRTWRKMKDRCTNHKHPSYRNYGGRGITICDRWLNSFENFYEDMSGPYVEGLEIDRIDVNGNYSKENCRWVTRAENSRNTRGKVNSTSIFKGVSWDSRRGKWKAQITFNGKNFQLGRFTDETEAAITYNQKAKEFFGDYAHLNVIEV